MPEMHTLNGDEDIGDAIPLAAEARGRVYRLLSELFAGEVTAELLAVLKGAEVVEAFKELDSCIGDLLIGPGSAALLDDLAEEYAALFLVPGGIPPYASVRLHGRLNQKSAWMAEEFYRRCGLAVREECRVLPDHLGMEFELMGYLAAKEAHALCNRDTQEAGHWLGLQREFFQDHLQRWAFGFLGDLQRYASHPFYRELGSLTGKFLELEKERLDTGTRGEESSFPGGEIGSVGGAQGGKP